MKHILTFILSLCFFASIGQVRLSDTANNGTFSYHLGNNFRGQYPKGSCYLDRDASGAFAIRRVTGAVVTPYVSMSNYELNGDVDTVFSSYIEKLNGIIMLSCGGVAPIETFAYCGAPVLNYWYCSDTTNYLADSACVFGTSNGVNPNYDMVYYPNDNSFPNGVSSYTNYPTNQQPNIQLGDCTDTANFNGTFENCNKIERFEFVWKESFTRSVDCSYYLPSAFELITGLQIDGVNTDMNILTINANVDTSIVNDMVSDTSIGLSSATLKRNLGVNITDINLNSTTETITLVAKPTKTSGTTYAASSFKIEKIAFADISAGTISGSSYNPNLGEQSNTFALTTGKNTFKVSVEDTDGNIAYSIFQVTKTQL